MDIIPIVQGEFIYRDVLLVDRGGELRRHPRASEAEIRRLLNGKDASDQVGHWWEAQIIHYGLPPSKQKNTCKVRLQQALSQGKLKAQPPHLAAMEAQMKKEYTAAIRKATRQSKLAAPASTEGKKRAIEEEGDQSSKKIKVTVKVGDVSVSIEEGTSAKQKTVRSTSKKVTPAKATQASVANAGPVRWSGDPRDHPENVFQRSSLDLAMDTPKPQSKLKTARSEPGPPTNTPKAATKPQKAKPKTVKTEKRVKGEPIYQDDQDEMDMRPDISQNQLNVTGVYNISCPKLARQAPDHADKFRLFMCVDNDAGRIWGGFDLAWKSGTIKVDSIAYDMQLTLGWRAREFDRNGSLRFGKGCVGNIEFFDRDRVRGTLYNLFPEQLDFEGSRRPGPLWCGKSAYKFQQEWDEYPKEAYGR